MIPKKIYYCWFGGQQNQPDIVKLCIDSWQYVLPDYQIICIDERNVNTNIPFNRQCLANKMYAYLSDSVRLEVLLNNTGIYLDTDILLVKPFSVSMRSQDFFIGAETLRTVGTGVMGVGKTNNPLLQQFYQYYLSNPKHPIHNNRYLSRLINTIYGGRLYKSTMYYDDCTIYTQDYLSPVPWTLGRKMKLSDNTTAIHLFTGSASSKGARCRTAQVFYNYKETLIPFLRNNLGNFITNRCIELLFSRQLQ